MYVKVSTVRSGKKTYRYLTLAESFRNEDGQPRSRIVARLGEVSEMTTSGEARAHRRCPLGPVRTLGASLGAHRRGRTLLWGDGRLRRLLLASFAR